MLGSAALPGKLELEADPRPTPDVLLGRVSVGLDAGRRRRCVGLRTPGKRERSEHSGHATTWTHGPNGVARLELVEP